MAENVPTTGRIIIISAPSGAGKTTILHAVLAQLPQLAFSISATTRPRRPHEVDGKDYYFLTPEQFSELLAEEAFLEWQQVYTGRYYGTLRSEVSRIQRQGQHPIFEVDVMGGVNLKQLFGASALSFFIQPPSLDALRARLSSRATEGVEEIERRLDKAVKELPFADRFDVIVLNDQLQAAVQQVVQHIEAFVAA